MYLNALEFVILRCISYHPRVMLRCTAKRCLEARAGLLGSNRLPRVCASPFEGRRAATSRVTRFKNFAILRRDTAHKPWRVSKDDGNTGRTNVRTPRIDRLETHQRRFHL
jgi:hypothetical protein